jgi:hypothetical protein
MTEQDVCPIKCAEARTVAIYFVACVLVNKYRDAIQDALLTDRLFCCPARMLLLSALENPPGTSSASGAEVADGSERRGENMASTEMSAPNRFKYLYFVAPSGRRIHAREQCRGLRSASRVDGHLIRELPDPNVALRRRMRVSSASSFETVECEEGNSPLPTIAEGDIQQHDEAVALAQAVQSLKIRTIMMAMQALRTMQDRQPTLPGTGVSEVPKFGSIVG